MAAKVKQYIRTGSDRIASEDEFKDLVQYERVRADRFGSSFSVLEVTFDQDARESMDAFIGRLLENKRSVDYVGWKQDGSYSVLLPDTGFKGAETFRDKLMNGWSKGGPSARYSVFSYPDHWMDRHARTDEEIELSAGVRSEHDEVENLFVRKMPVWKRVMDLTLTILMLVLLLPFFLVVAVYIKVVSPGPIFFMQPRIGFKGIPFMFWKFRTMDHGNNQQMHGKHSQEFIQDGDVPMDKLDAHDPRIIPGGRLLRASCIDELPQLWNVLRGDMSLVGPRPCIPYEARAYLRWHTHRFDTVPGLTGLWQVSGKNKLTFRQMIRLDIQYCQNLSLLRDFSILLKTPLVVIKLLLESVLHKERDIDAISDTPSGEGSS